MLKIQHIPTKSLVTKSKISGVDYVINPYVGCPHRCVYCYAEYMRKFTGHSEPWGDFLDVKIINHPLQPAKLFHAKVLLCSATDPYHPYEAQFQVTRQLLKQLIFCEADVHILTKSALVVRDMDLLKQLWKCEVAFSFSTANEEIRQLLEPGAASVAQRIEALQTLQQAGIPTAVMAAPLFPMISNWKEIIEATCRYTSAYRFDSLNLKPGFQKRLISLLGQHYPEILPLYSDIYLHRNDTYWKELSREIAGYCRAHNLQADIFFFRNEPGT